MTLVSTSGPMCRLAFTHLVEIAFPLNLAEMRAEVEQPLALQELAKRAVDQRLLRRLAGQRHRLAHHVLVEDDVRSHTPVVYQAVCIRCIALRGARFGEELP